MLDPIAAVIVKVSLLLTWFVVTVKVVVVAPLGTVTVAGTWASPPLLERLTVTPDGPAAWPIVTVPVLVLPPITVVGFSESELTVFGLTVIVCVTDVPLPVAVIVTVWVDVTGRVVTVNVPVVAPAATVIEAGTVAAEVFELVIVIVLPDGPA